jgi:hypothetical protein
MFSDRVGNEWNTSTPGPFFEDIIILGENLRYNMKKNIKSSARS